jgi:uncharacterized NAD(P)/FAD-binding protein YdhS
MVDYPSKRGGKVGTERDCVRVAIIGGGASGVLTAIHLLRVVPNGQIDLVERSNALGGGIAYSTDAECHVLNVRAANMSALPDDPCHFVTWLEGQEFEDQDPAKRFVPRSLYRRYLQDCLREAQLGSSSILSILRDEATSLAKKEKLCVSLADSKDLAVDHAVLAIGNLPPCLPPGLAEALDCGRIITNPWERDVFSPIRADTRVLIVGTGLTMVDTVLSLLAQGHQGPIHARSRHGLVSKPHGPATPIPLEIRPEEEVIPKIIGALRNSGEDWRGVVDALRPQTVELWQRLSWTQRRRFRNRLQVFWDVFRHRMPETAASQLKSASCRGQFNVAKGRLIRVTEIDGHLNVTLNGLLGREHLEVDWIVNCTGPSTDLRTAKLPILESAVANGLVDYDPLSIGVMVDHLGRSVSCGQVWALGPICRGCRLETTAIPEIRAQAKNIAAEIGLS